MPAILKARGVASSNTHAGLVLRKAVRTMHRRFHLLAVALLTFATVTRADTPATKPATTSTTLFNGWRISPAGTHAKIESMPLKMLFSPDGKYLAAVCG